MPNLPHAATIFPCDAGSRIDLAGRAADLAFGICCGYGFGVTSLYVSEASDNLQDFAARWKHPSAGSFVRVHRLHEFNFLQRVVPFARCRVNLPTPLNLAPLVRASLDGHRGILLATVRTGTTIGGSATVHFHFVIVFCYHRAFLPNWTGEPQSDSSTAELLNTIDLPVCENRAIGKEGGFWWVLRIEGRLVFA
jgi:hypothetical protein